MKAAASPRSMKRSQLFWHSLFHIRRFSPLRMTKRGDTRRSVDRRFSSYRQPSPRGEGAPKGRIGHWRYEREREGASQAGDLRKHPSAADAVPLPRWGRLRGVTLRRDPSTQVAAVLAFVISHTTFFSAQDDEMRRTIPALPIEPAKTLSQIIKGQHALGANPSPESFTYSHFLTIFPS